MNCVNSKYIFIVGQHRTGSTLLKNILDAHQDVYMAKDELNMFEPFRRNTLDRYINKDGKVHIGRLLSHIEFERVYGSFWQEQNEKSNALKVIKELYVEEDLVEFDEFVIEFISAMANESGKPFYGIKYPVHLSNVKYLFKLFPLCSVLFITRDPIALVSSKLNDPATKKRKRNSGRVRAWLVHYSTLMYFVIEYIVSSIIYAVNSKRLILIRYEELVCDRNKLLDDVCEQLGLDDCSLYKMMDATGKESSYKNNGSKNQNVFGGTDLERYKKHMKWYDLSIVFVLTFLFKRLFR